MAIEFTVVDQVELLLPTWFDVSGVDGQQLMSAWKQKEVEFFYYKDGEKPLKILFPENADDEERAAMFYDLYQQGKAKIFYKGGVARTIKVGE